MRQSSAAILIVVLLLLIVVCLFVIITGIIQDKPTYVEEPSYEQPQNTVSIDKIVAAFRDAGYIIEIGSAQDDPDMDPSNYDMAGLEGVTGYQFGKKNPIYGDGYLVEQGSLVFLKLKNADSAESYFEMAAQGARSNPQAIVESSKITVRATVGDRSQYGSSDVISLVGDTIIIMAVEWDDYQDAEITYHFKPEEILAELGY